MDGIFFLIIAFLVAFTSIRLSYYGDILSKQTKLASALIGGLLIASVTSLPEFVTSISAVIIGNPGLSYGDILGSNMFNIFVLGIYNIVFFRKSFFDNSKKKYLIECLILILDYIFIFLNLKYLSTIMLFVLYFLYAYKIINHKEEKEKYHKKEKYVLLKFIITSLILIVLSVVLTISADRLTRIYPNISTSSIGAILLGITTSLPEVVTTFELIKLDNYDMAISNILGSNIFNFLVLSTSDLFNTMSIYGYKDKYSNMYLFGGSLVTLLLLISLLKKNKLYSIIISILITCIYLVIWYFQFS